MKQVLIIQKTFWGKDFLTVRVDDEGGDKAFTSVDIRPGTYTAETLASEVERAINNALSDDKKVLDPLKMVLFLSNLIKLMRMMKSLH